MDSTDDPAASQPDQAVSWPRWPLWYVSPAGQLAHARYLWPDDLLPKLPKSFQPKTPTELLLLHVPRPFDYLWKAVVAPAGYSKYSREEEWEIHSVSDELYTEPVWLAFDPEYGRGESSQSLWAQCQPKPRLAGAEVLSALLQFPRWASAWPEAAAPNLSAYRIDDGLPSLRVPSVRRWDGGRHLALVAFPAGRESNSKSDCQQSYWASPSVREC
jgi:hypothetical protein